MDRTDTGNVPKLDLDEMMARIRAEVADRGRQAEETGPANGSDLSSAVPDTAGFALTAHELLALPVAEFVRASHLALLGREPQPDEFVGLRDRLLVGKVGRMRVLREFRSSGEGRARHLRVEGLMREFVWDRIYWSPPAKFGRLVGRIAAAIWRLPRNIRQFIARVETLERRASDAGLAIKAIHSNRAADRQTAAAHASQVQREMEQLRGRTDTINRALSDRAQAIEGRARAIEGSAARTKAEIDAQIAEIHTTLIDHWRNIVDYKLRADALRVSASPASAPAANGPATARAEKAHLLDPLYLSFEDRYRGTRADIKQRQSVFVALVEACVRATGGAPVVDLGCGRGEWLEVLADSGIAAQGYDMNRIAVEECRQRGLDARSGEAIEALAALPDNSCSVVTGFHIIEHLPFEALVALIDHALRVLRPGGAIVLETPNPANVIVAAERFYFDPTHRNPLPSELTSYLLKSRGFGEIEVLPLHPVEWQSRQDYIDPMLAYLQDKLFGPQDYGVVGRKGA
jgi:2-polyprenyl-3-methyl-5-hydroxy-6-metoxy-1,4-benzoquinol methylase